MRLLGLDYGTRRLGLAISDEDGIIANPIPPLERSRSLNRDLMTLRRLVREREIGAVVIGLPYNMDGSEGEMVRAVKAFADELRKRIGIQVIGYDERRTTQKAEGALLDANLTRKRRKELRDSVAAALILRSYLDERGSAQEEPPGN